MFTLGFRFKVLNAIFSPHIPFTTAITPTHIEEKKWPQFTNNWIDETTLCCEIKLNSRNQVCVTLNLRSQSILLFVWLHLQRYWSCTLLLLWVHILFVSHSTVSVKKIYFFLIHFLKLLIEFIFYGAFLSYLQRNVKIDNRKFIYLFFYRGHKNYKKEKFTQLNIIWHMTSENNKKNKRNELK